ncbi:MAG: calcium/sodium antiporter [Hyphomonadaceae bacterium]
MEAAFQIIAGLILLTAGGEGVIRGAVGLARKLGLSEFLIGVTLVGFGTSAPELLTSIEAAVLGSPGIALGNVLGSNISNILLILGLVAIIRPIQTVRSAVCRDGALVVLLSIALAGLAYILAEFDRWVGMFMVLALIVYIANVWRAERRSGVTAIVHKEDPQGNDPASTPFWLSALFALGGLLLLLCGADLLVHGAITTARLVGISETVIGMTIVAIGTSLPELVATLAAALRGRSDIALGSILGSNTYNILGIVGVTALVHPIVVPADIGLIDWATLIGSAALLVVFARTGRQINRLEGVVLLSAYISYAVFLFIR